jgi:hypothetical protein
MAQAELTGPRASVGRPGTGQRVERGSTWAVPRRVRRRSRPSGPPVGHRVDGVDGERQGADDLEVADHQRQRLWRRSAVEQFGDPVTVVHRRRVRRQDDGVLCLDPDVAGFATARLTLEDNRQYLLANRHLGAVVVVNVDLGRVNTRSKHAPLELIAFLHPADELDAVADQPRRLLLRRERQPVVDVVDSDQGRGASVLVDGVEAAVGGERRVQPAVRLAECETAGVPDGVAGPADGRVDAGGRVQPPKGAAGPVDALDRVALAGEVVDVSGLPVGRADEGGRTRRRVDLEGLRGGRVVLVDSDQPSAAVERQAAFEDEPMPSGPTAVAAPLVTSIR